MNPVWKESSKTMASKLSDAIEAVDLDSQIFAASPFSPLAPNLNGSPQPGSRDAGSGRKSIGRNSISLPAKQCQRLDQ
jgi:hypothetical protein